MQKLQPWAAAGRLAAASAAAGQQLLQRGCLGHCQSARDPAEVACCDEENSDRQLLGHFSAAQVSIGYFSRLNSHCPLLHKVPNLTAHWPTLYFHIVPGDQQATAMLIMYLHTRP